MAGIFIIVTFRFVARSLLTEHDRAILECACVIVRRSSFVIRESVGGRKE
jgi:hypothetical protein